MDTIKKYVLENDELKIQFIDVGATIYQFFVKSKNRNIVLNHQDLNLYLSLNSGFVGATIGRVTNRINDGFFHIDGNKYTLEKNFDGEVNHGHSANACFSNKKFICVKKDDQSIIFEYFSPHMDGGYPGNLRVQVTYELKKSQLFITYNANTDYATPVNLTNHTYFNLSNEKDILNHDIEVTSTHIQPYDDLKRVQEQELDISNTILDLTHEKRLLKIIFDDSLNNELTRGLDHSYIFNQNKRVLLTGGGLALKVETSYPAVQIYTGGFLDQVLGRFSRYQGIAIEPQLPVNCINFTNQYNIILRPNQGYQHYILYTITEI